jgi:hypothetical protein
MAPRNIDDRCCRRTIDAIRMNPPRQYERFIRDDVIRHGRSSDFDFPSQVFTIVLYVRYQNQFPRKIVS